MQFFLADFCCLSKDKKTKKDQKAEKMILIKKLCTTLVFQSRKVLYFYLKGLIKEFVLLKHLLITAQT